MRGDDEWMENGASRTWSMTVQGGAGWTREPGVARGMVGHDGNE